MQAEVGFYVQYGNNTGKPNHFRQALTSHWIEHKYQAFFSVVLIDQPREPLSFYCKVASYFSNSDLKQACQTLSPGFECFHRFINLFFGISNAGFHYCVGLLTRPSPTFGRSLIKPSHPPPNRSINIIMLHLLCFLVSCRERTTPLVYATPNKFYKLHGHFESSIKNVRHCC